MLPMAHGSGKTQAFGLSSSSSFTVVDGNINLFPLIIIKPSGLERKGERQSLLQGQLMATIFLPQLSQNLIREKVPHGLSLSWNQGLLGFPFYLTKGWIRSRSRGRLDTWVTQSHRKLTEAEDGAGDPQAGQPLPFSSPFISLPSYPVSLPCCLLWAEYVLGVWATCVRTCSCCHGVPSLVGDQDILTKRNSMVCG